MWLEWILVGEKKSGDCAISQPRNNLSRYFSSKNMNPYLVWGICLAVVCLERGLERVYISHISTLVVVVKKKFTTRNKGQSTVLKFQKYLKK